MTIKEAVNKATEGGYHINGSDGIETYYSGVSSHRLDGQASRLRVEKLLHCPTRVIPRPVLNYKNMLRSLRQDIEQKSRITFGVEASRMAFKEKPP